MKRRRRDEALHDAGEHGHEAPVSCHEASCRGCCARAQSWMLDAAPCLHESVVTEGGADINKQVRTWRSDPQLWRRCNDLYRLLASLNGHVTALLAAKESARPMSCPCWSGD